MWSKDSYLRQLPHFTKELIDKCVEKVISSFCFLGMSLTYALREWKVFSTSWSWRTRTGTSCWTCRIYRWRMLQDSATGKWLSAMTDWLTILTCEQVSEYRQGWPRQRPDRQHRGEAGEGGRGDWAGHCAFLPHQEGGGLVGHHRSGLGYWIERFGY